MKNRVQIEFTAKEIAVLERSLIWGQSYLFNLLHEKKINKILSNEEEESLRSLNKEMEKLKDDINKISKPLFDKREKLIKERDERNTKRFWKSLGIKK